jgi:hypothetical protein
MSLEELSAIEQAKETTVSTPLIEITYPSSNTSAASGHRMFSQHFHQPKCDSCYASKLANNQAARAYQTLISSSPSSSTVSIPSKPKQVPFIAVLK